MKGSTKLRIAKTVLAIGILGVAAGANASTAVHISVGMPAGAATPVHFPPQDVYVFPAHTVHMPAYEVYDSPPIQERRYGEERAWRSNCRVPRWAPHVRYMPGDVVRRHGDLFVARGISASVWNENSPPEWTPKYWAAAECR